MTTQKHRKREGRSLPRLPTSKERYLLYSSEWGIYLGYQDHLSFWSKLGSMGITAAFTFQNPEDAISTINDLEEADKIRDSFRTIPVEPDFGEYISMERCVHYGLPGWLDEHTICYNAIMA